MTPLEVYDQRVLLACLNWGKGHVARSIGLIEQLIQQKNDVVVAGDQDQIKIFKTYFPDIECLLIPSYPFYFGGKGDFGSDLWRNRKLLKKAIQSESKLINRLVVELNVSLIISDHRYGFYSKKAPSIFLTHQLNLPLKWWQFPAQWIHEKMMGNFDCKWILDIEENPLAGKLSARKNHKNLFYIGHYSRFMNNTKESDEEISVLICNGPSPYDEQLLLKYLDQIDSLQLIVPEVMYVKYQHVNMHSSSDWKNCDGIIRKANKVYAYCGYSTLMDAQFLKADFQLTPTVGQMEQLYLYDLHFGKSRKQ